MYKRILVCLDNSRYSRYGMDIAIRLGSFFNAEVTGLHVYAARLHESRFMDLETGLPERYRSEAILKRQRDIHMDLIEKGLGLISCSYLDGFRVMAEKEGVVCRCRSREGRNYVEIIREIEEGDYDLLVMGGMGLGEVEYSIIGGVCERVVRQVRKDVLIVKEGFTGGRIMVGIDGSRYSYGALMCAIGLKKVSGCDVEAISVYDPYFHKIAFRNIAEVLTDDASSVFRFKEQEQLHDEVIDRGLASLYQSYLDIAHSIAERQGVEIKTTLLAGKAFNEMLKAAQNTSTPFIITVGRFGLHKTPLSSIGNTSENILRMATTNVLITNREFNEVVDKTDMAFEDMEWSEGAVKRIERVPDFVRAMVRKTIMELAMEKGCREITEDLVDEARRYFTKHRTVNNR